MNREVWGYWNGHLVMKKGGENQMPRAQPKMKQAKELQIETEETKPINRLLLPVSAYRTLAKLAADQEPIVRLNAYCEKVLIEHTKLKGKKG
jgi:hypothetical protein